MFENLINLFKKKSKSGEDKTNKETAKERLHLVLMQDRANVSADFLELMKQEIIDVKLTNKMNSDGTTGAPALYANIPIKSIKNETRKISSTDLKAKEKNNKSEKASNIEKTDDKKEKSDNNSKDNEQKRKETLKNIEEKLDVIEEKLEINQEEKDSKKEVTEVIVEENDKSQKEVVRTK